MVQQVYTIIPPRGNGYRIAVEVPDDPGRVSCGGRNIVIDANLVKSILDEIIARNTEYGAIVPYFTGHLKCLKTLGIVSHVTTEEIPREENPPEAPEPKPNEPQPLWAAWGRI